MKGKYSIKNVLPALVPSFSYNVLEINNGKIASIEFENLCKLNDQNKIKEIRKNLLEYCKMDTFAMVKILEVLRKV